MEVKTLADIETCKQMADNGTMPDQHNPAFLFSCISNSILVDIVSGNVDAMLLAKNELAARGLGVNGEWVGFDKAKKVHGLI